MQDWYRKIYASVEKAATNPENINDDGSVNWDFVDSDCFMEYQPSDKYTEMYYCQFAEAVNEYVRKDLPFGDDEPDEYEPTMIYMCEKEMQFDEVFDGY